MNPPIPTNPKLYHIVHVDRLPAIVADGCLWCDAEVSRRAPAGTTIGLNAIKLRRLNELTLASHPGVHVGDCVPFYFCPRSVMLYSLYRGNDAALAYHGGQGPIIHLECDLREVVAWADAAGRRWAFTTSNAGAYYFEDRCDLAQLEEINWPAVEARQWGGAGVARAVKEGKQAEFLLEHRLPWRLVGRIGVHSAAIAEQAKAIVVGQDHRPPIEVRPDWYY